MEPIASLFQAFSDQTRLRILNLLLRRAMCVCDITQVLEIPQPRASRHLSFLKRAGLVENMREAERVFYRLKSPPSGLARELLETLRRHRRLVPGSQRDLGRFERLIRSGKVCRPQRGLWP